LNRTVATLLAAALLAARAPAQLDPPPEPPENPVTAEKAVLGKILFWDEQLSSDNTVACGTCHRPAFGGSDPRPFRLAGPDGLLGTADDVFGSPGIVRSDECNFFEPDPVHGFDPQVTGRSSQSFVMAAYDEDLFWDGRASTTFLDPVSGAVSIAYGGGLESQAAVPVLSGVEMGHAGRDWSEVTAKLATARPLALADRLPPDVETALAADPGYPDLFAAAFGDGAITAERIAWAIATYERTLVPDQTPWDRHFAGDSTALTDAQKEGLRIFTFRAGCAACHSPPLFADAGFHNIGLRDPATDPGREAVTGDPADRGRFKTPSLRQLASRPRTMHTGQFDRIDDVVEFYDRGGDFSDNLDPLIAPLGLTAQEKLDLADFLAHGLDDPRMLAETAPFDRPRLHSEQKRGNPAVYGAGSAGSGGFVPAMLFGAPPNLGNVDFRFGLRDALAGAPALLVLSEARDAADFGGIPVLVDFSRALGILGWPLTGSGEGGGRATCAVAIPGDPALAGFVFVAQWFVIDPQAAGGVAASDGLECALF